MKKYSKAKKLAVAMLAVLTISTSVTVLVGCNKTPTNIKLGTKDMYAMSAVSSMQFLTSNTASVSDITTVASTTRPSDITDDVVNKIDSVLVMFQGFLNGNGIDKQESKPNENDGEYKDYQNKIVITLPFDDKKAVYTMYYNGGEPTTEQDDDEIETTTPLKGVIVFGEGDNKQVYEITGKKEVETENGETEEEIEFTTKLDEKNYVIVKEEKEAGEVEYEYTLCKDGKITETSIEWEEDKKGNLSLSLEIEDSKGNEVEYEIKKVKEDTYLVEFENNDKEQKIDVVRLDDGKFKFTYKNGFVEIR